MAKQDIYRYIEVDPAYEPGFHWVTKDIALGSYPLESEIQTLLDAGVTAIVSLRMDEPDYDLERFQTACVMLVEDGTPFPYPYLVEGLAFLHEALLEGNKVYVHCFAGISRSAFFVSCYLMLRDNITFDEAVGRVQSVRSKCQPNPMLYDETVIDRLLADKDRIFSGAPLRETA